MKVLHVIPRIARCLGGPSRSSQGLVAALREAGVEARLCPLEPSDPPWIDGVGEYVDAADALKKFQPDLVHIHEIWNPRLHRVARQCRQKGIPYVVAPRGMLEPWSLRQKWFKKRVARILYQDADLKGAAALHATAESEAEQFLKLGFRNPVIVSPNGVTLPARFQRESQADQPHRALFMSRMHDGKGVLELIESWARVKSEGWICELVYTVRSGEESVYEERCKARARELGVDGQVCFTGALDDEKKWAAYARADLFVLPTSSENFGIVVAEALWAGLPVITTKGAPWQELETRRCGWWINLPPTDSLDRALREATSLTPAELRDKGRRGHDLVEEKYTWAAVSRQMMAGYERI